MHDATADMAFALLLSAARNVVQGDAFVRDPTATAAAFKEKVSGWMGKEVRGSTLGIVGMGRIGFKVAVRAVAGRGKASARHLLRRA